jgi:ABC-type spermidine/putrescine transport system permease subunit II
VARGDLAQYRYRHWGDRGGDEFGHPRGGRTVEPAHAGAANRHGGADLAADRPSHHHRGRRLSFYAPIGLANSFTGIIIAQTTVAAPFVVVTVGASLANFDRTLMRAAAISGAHPFVAFWRVMLPLILPGVLSGAAFGFVASFDELVIALFLAGPSQRTLPMQMFVGLREHLDPTITAAATLMMALSVLLLVVADRLRR